MTPHKLSRRFAVDRRTPAYQAMLACGLWLRAGFVALSGAVIALIMLASGEATLWIAIAAAVIAAVFERWSWYKARAALDVESADARAAVAETAARPRADGFAVASKPH